MRLPPYVHAFIDRHGKARYYFRRRGSKQTPLPGLPWSPAQRRADVVQMGRQHVRDGLIHVRQSKTGATLAIPLHPELRAVLEVTPAEHLTFLIDDTRRPFVPA